MKPSSVLARLDRTGANQPARRQRDPKGDRKVKPVGKPIRIEDRPPGVYPSHLPFQESLVKFNPGSFAAYHSQGNQKPSLRKVDKDHSREGTDDGVANKLGGDESLEL